MCENHETKHLTLPINVSLNLPRDEHPRGTTHYPPPISRCRSSKSFFYTYFRVLRNRFHLISAPLYFQEYTCDWKGLKGKGVLVALWSLATGLRDVVNGWEICFSWKTCSCRLGHLHNGTYISQAGMFCAFSDRWAHRLVRRLIELCIQYVGVLLDNTGQSRTWRTFDSTYKMLFCNHATKQEPSAMQVIKIQFSSAE